MIEIILRLFGKFKSESKFLNYIEGKGSFISLQEIVINDDEMTIGTKDGKKVIDKKVKITFIPLRQVFTKFLQLPNIFEETMSYVEKLENNDMLLSNLIIGTFWKSKKEQFRNRLVLPFLIYQDDFETNNALGRARGVWKIGAVYYVIPYLPKKGFITQVS